MVVAVVVNIVMVVTAEITAVKVKMHCEDRGRMCKRVVAVGIAVTATRAFEWFVGL